MRREKLTILCPCDRAKQFPIVIEYDENDLKGPNTKELHCPFCQDIIAIELPGAVLNNETTFRGSKVTEQAKTKNSENRQIIIKLADGEISKSDS